MKFFVLFIAILTNSGELEVSHDIVEECPENNGYFEAAMDLKKVHGEFLSWSAACFYLDMNPSNRL
jgi:hypothetical protein